MPITLTANHTIECCGKSNERRELGGRPGQWNLDSVTRAKALHRNELPEWDASSCGGVDRPLALGGGCRHGPTVDGLG